MKKYLLFITACLLCSDYSSGQSECDTLFFDSYGSSLRGYFYAAADSEAPTLVFMQAFFDNGDIWDTGNTLSGNGINVFMFNFRGCFASKGKQGLMNSQQDIGSALAFLKSEKMITNYNIDTSKIILGGYSYGGHMSMLYAVHHSEIKRIISISGGDLGILCDMLKADPGLFRDYSDFFKSIKKPDGPVEFEYDDPINELVENQDYFYILKQTNKLAGTDIFMTGGLDDNTVGLEKMILPMYRAIKKNKEQKIKCNVYQTNHSYKNVTSKLLDDIVKWIK